MTPEYARMSDETPHECAKCQGGFGDADPVTWYGPKGIEEPFCETCTDSYLAKIAAEAIGEGLSELFEFATQQSIRSKAA